MIYSYFKVSAFTAINKIILFVYKSYTKGVPFESNVKGPRVGPRGRVSPYKTLLSIPPGKIATH